MRAEIEIPDDWNGEDWCFQVLCVPDSRLWRGVVNGVIYDLARGRTWDADTGSITDAQEVGREIFNSMSNCNEGLVNIASALENIAAKLGNALSNCGCPEGTGTVFEPEENLDGPGIGIGLEFENQGEYDAYKCNVANLIFDKMIQVFTDLAEVGADFYLKAGTSISIGFIGAVLAAAPLTLVGGLAVGVVTAFLTLFVSNKGFVLNNILAQMAAKKTALICALYTATSATGAREAFNQVLDDPSLTVVEKEAINIFLNNQWLNLLITDDGSIGTKTAPTPSSCVGCCDEINVQFGSLVSGSTYASTETVDGNHAIVIAFWFDGSVGCGLDTDKTVDIVSLSGWTPNTQPDPANDQSFRFSSTVSGQGSGCLGWDVYCDDLEPTVAQVCRKLNIRSDTPFEAEFSIS